MLIGVGVEFRSVKELVRTVGDNEIMGCCNFERCPVCL